MPSTTALIVVDMINSYDHPDGEKLAESVKQTLPKMAELIERAADEDVQVIYVNDNFGAWNSNREELVEEAMKALRGSDRADPPEHDTAFVVKARHSIFYETPLEYLLRENDIERVVLIGQATEQCILYSALDALHPPLRGGDPARRGRPHSRAPGRGRVRDDGDATWTSRSSTRTTLKLG